MVPAESYFKLCQETATIEWSALARFFAQGRVLLVAAGLELPAVAAALADDDAQAVAGWKAAGQLAPVPDAQAKRWFDDDAVVWAVTVVPFILVQEQKSANDLN